MKKRTYLLFFLALSLVLCSCGTGEFVETELFAMDTVVQLRVWGEEALLEEAGQEIYRLAALFSVTDESSELYALNRDGTADLSPETVELIQTAAALSARTGGAFDPTVYPLVQLWGFTTGEYHVPGADAIAQALDDVGAEHLHLEESVTLEPGTMLDLGGIAKGYAAQRCAELLDQGGATAALLYLGGNVQTLGSKPDGSDWQIGIANPGEPSEALAKLTFSGSKAVVTSGSYQRYFEEDGRTYHHILDPETGRPTDNGLASVTVLAEDGTLADGLSTALFVMGLADAADFWRDSEDFEAVFILENGSVYATEGAAAMLSGCEFTVIRR